MATIAGVTSVAAALAGSNMTAMAKLAGLFRREFTRLMVSESWASELRPPMYGTLQVLAARGVLSQREVADIVMLHPSDMVALIDDLERLGLVRRERDPGDRRRYQLNLTEEGRGVLARYDEVAQRAEAIVLGPLSEQERTTLARLCEKAVANVVIGESHERPGGAVASRSGHATKRPAEDR